jgi:hypothetical protein
MRIKGRVKQDAKGMDVQIWHTDTIGQEPLLTASYYRATLFLLEKGWGMTPYELASSSHRAIFLTTTTEPEEFLGGVIWEYHSYNKQAMIVLIWTEDKWRGRHLYTLLQHELERESVICGGTSIASMAHADNEPRLKAGAREGMFPQFHRLYKDLSPDLFERKKQIAEEAGKPWREINRDRYKLESRMTTK